MGYRYYIKANRTIKPEEIVDFDLAEQAMDSISYGLDWFDRNKIRIEVEEISGTEDVEIALKRMMSSLKLIKPVTVAFNSPGGSNDYKIRMEVDGKLYISKRITTWSDYELFDEHDDDDWEPEPREDDEWDDEGEEL